MAKVDSILHRMRKVSPVSYLGRIQAIRAGVIHVAGLNAFASVGDRICIDAMTGRLYGEIIGLSQHIAEVLPEGAMDGLCVGTAVKLIYAPEISPCNSWIGRIIDPFCAPLDGKPLATGKTARPLHCEALPAISRKGLGARIATGMAVFDTLLPLTQGQRIGLFSGSGVGKSMLLSQFARDVQADVIVIAMIGERGREVREFVENALGHEKMARSVVVAATSDRSPLIRRRCAWTAMAIAEHFRDEGKQVLLLADSVTRFAEAHREIALIAGEPASYRGFPPSVSNLIMALAERAGPGQDGSGDITAIFTVLVAGSDMDEPIADILRGTLDGHVILDRKIAERGRFPAVDVVRSVSRSLPAAATKAENAMISRARAMLGHYGESELMIRAGLYAPGTDKSLDEAVRLFPQIDAFISKRSRSIPESFEALTAALRIPGTSGK